MNDRAVGLFDNYEIEVGRTWKGRGAILCESDKGIFILKEYNGPVNKIYFQDTLLKHIRETGFPLVESILRTKEDELIEFLILLKVTLKEKNVITERLKNAVRPSGFLPDYITVRTCPRGKIWLLSQFFILKKSMKSITKS